jgi:hypothetical protein
MKQIPYCGRTNSGRHRPKSGRRGDLVRGICAPTLSRDIVFSTLLSDTLSHCLSLDLRDHISGGTRFESRLGVRLFLMRGILCCMESALLHEPP